MQKAEMALPEIRHGARKSNAKQWCKLLARGAERREAGRACGKHRRVKGQKNMSKYSQWAVLLGKNWFWPSPVCLWIIFSCHRPSSPVQVPRGAFILTKGPQGKEIPQGLHSKPMAFKTSYRDTHSPTNFYHIHWLLTHLRLRRLKGRTVLLNKDFSGDLKEPIDL